MRKAIVVPIFVLLALVQGLVQERPSHATSIKGSESAAHGFDAVSCRIVNGPDSRPGFDQTSGPEITGEMLLAAGSLVHGPEIQAGKATQAASSPIREVKLPERIGPTELRRLMLDLPGTFELVDIRPAEQFADYSIPGSRNVDIADAIQNPSLLTGAGPLILVDRDGSLAMAVGGILCQKTQRVIKVLHGGLQAYWEETEKGIMTGQSSGGTAVSPGISGGKVPSPPPASISPAAPEVQDVPKTAPAAPQTPAPPKPETKPKSAGC